MPSRLVPRPSPCVVSSARPGPHHLSVHERLSACATPFIPAMSRRCACPCPTSHCHPLSQPHVIPALIPPSMPTLSICACSLSRLHPACHLQPAFRLYLAHRRPHLYCTVHWSHRPSSSPVPTAPMAPYRRICVTSLHECLCQCGVLSMRRTKSTCSI